MQQLSQKLLGLVFSWQFPKQPRTYRSVQDDIWLRQEVQHRASLLFPREMLPRQDKLSPTLPASSLKGLKTTSLKWTPAIHPSLLPESLDWSLRVSVIHSSQNPIPPPPCHILQGVSPDFLPQVLSAHQAWVSPLSYNAFTSLLWLDWNDWDLRVSVPSPVTHR